MLIKKLLLCFMAGVFLLVDQGLKWQALHGWSQERLLNKYLGWYPFLNPGVAFGLPIPSVLILLITLPIIVALLVYLWKQWAVLSVRGVAGGALIIAGAVSNFGDRFVYAATVDYIKIFTGVINVADVLIVAGFVIYFVGLRERS